jgi:Bacterial regulatory protein, Fis family
MPSLAKIEKIAVLQAIVQSRYDLRAAARGLVVGRTTLYRKLRQWNLTPPMFAARAGARVLRKDFVNRCEAIREALKEVTR